MQKTIELFFEKMGVVIDSLKTEKQDGGFHVKIQSPDSGILIGPHGKHLDSISHVLKQLLYKSTGERVKLHLEINDYNKTKDERLFSFIEAKVAQLKATHKEIELPYYSGYERKKIHAFIAEKNDPDISTKSIGEGRSRRLHLSIKNTPAKKLTIDIDGDTI